MKIFDKRNLVYFAAQEAWDRYGAYLDGLLSGPVCVVSERTLPEAARHALDASAKQLDYGEHALTCITIFPKSGSDEEAQPLSVKQVYGIIESIDPIVLIATDSQAMAVLSRAYHEDFPRDAAVRLLGRTAVGFIDFPAMLSTTPEKQKAWVHLKRLGHKPKAR